MGRAADVLIIPVQSVPARRDSSTGQLLRGRTYEPANPLRRKAKDEAAPELHEHQAPGGVVFNGSCPRLDSASPTSFTSRRLELALEIRVLYGFGHGAAAILQGHRSRLEVTICKARGVGRAHVVVSAGSSAESRPHADVRRLVLARRRMDVDAEAAVVVDLDHGCSYDPALGAESK